MFKYPSKNINDLALDYMKDKYGEEFEYSSPYGDSTTGSHQLLVKNENYPNQNILVKIDNYKKKEKEFYDNFLAVKYRIDVKDWLKEKASSVYSDANVFMEVSISPLSSNLLPDSSFETYFSDPSAEIHPIIEIKESDYESAEKITALADIFKDNSGCYYASVVFVADNEYGLSDYDDMKDRMRSGNYIHCAKITGDKSDYEIRWLEEE